MERFEQIAGEAVGSAHPDGGAAAGKLACRKEEAGPRSVVMVAGLEVGRLEHVLVRWYGMRGSSSLETKGGQELANL